MRRPTFLFLLFFCALIFGHTASPEKLPENYFFGSNEGSSNPIEIADSLFNAHDYPNAIETYQLVLSDKQAKPSSVLKKMALSHAALNHAKQATDYIEKYLISDFNSTFLLDTYFEGIQESPEFKNLRDRYVPSMTFWSFL